MASRAVAKQEAAEVAVKPTAELAPPSMFASLVSDAHVIDGGELVKDDLLDALVGVPFAWTEISFLEGDVFNKERGENNPYACLTTVIADEAWLRKRRVDIDRLPFDPEDTVLFNDGSTGIYRQVCEYLNAAGYIELVKNPDDLVRGGEKGESSFDLPPHAWHDVKRGDIRFTETGFGLYTVTLEPAVFCKRGIRISEYSNAFTKDGKTRYIA